MKIVNGISLDSNLVSQAPISNYLVNSRKEDKIVLKTLNSYYLIPVEDIIFCNSDGNYTTFYLETERITISKSMKKVEGLLPVNLFLKCHQSYLVNKNYVYKYISDGFLITSLKHEIPVSTRRKDYVLSSLFML